MLRSLLALMEHTCISDLQYRVELAVAALGWVDFEIYDQSTLPAPQPILPNYQQLPNQNGAGCLMSKIKVNPTNPGLHPVYRYKAWRPWMCLLVIVARVPLSLSC